MFIRKNRRLGEGANLYFDPDTFAAFFAPDIRRELALYVDEMGNIENWATQIIEDSGARNFEEFVYDGPETIPAYDPSIIYGEPEPGGWIPQGQSYVENGMLHWTPNPEFADFTDPLIPSLPPVVQVENFTRVSEPLPSVVDVQPISDPWDDRFRNPVFDYQGPMPTGPVRPPTGSTLPPANAFSPVPQIPVQSIPAPTPIAPSPVVNSLPSPAVVPAPLPIFTPAPPSGSGPTRDLPSSVRPAPVVTGLLPGEGGEGRAGILDVSEMKPMAVPENRGWLWIGLLVAGALLTR